MNYVEYPSAAQLDNTSLALIS